MRLRPEPEAGTVDDPRRARLRRLLIAILFATFVVPIILHSASLIGSAWFLDYQVNVWEPGKAVLAGHAPYPTPPYDVPAWGKGPVYPPALFLTMLPLTVLGSHAAGVVMAVLIVICFASVLLLLGVRDPLWWVAAMSAPVAFCVYNGNPTALVILPVAIAWVERDRAWRAGIALAVAIGIKFFVAPLIAWLLYTRRFRAAVIAAVGSVVLIVGSWALIGFSGFLSFPSLLRADAVAVGKRGLFLQAFARQLGLSYTSALILGVLVCALIIALARELPDEACFAACLAASLALSPIVWTYYLWLGLLALLVANRSKSALGYALGWCVLSYWIAMRTEGPLITSIALATVAAMFIVAIAPHVRAEPGIKPVPRPA